MSNLNEKRLVAAEIIERLETILNEMNELYANVIYLHIDN